MRSNGILRRRTATLTGTRKDRSQAQARSQSDFAIQTLSAPSPSENRIYPTQTTRRRISLRRSKPQRPRHRSLSISHTRAPSIVLAAYKASCMRKSRPRSPLNVGELQITLAHVQFTAHYLNVAPEDAQVILPIQNITAVRSAGYRRVLPYGVLVKTQAYPDYLMVLADEEQQLGLLQVLTDALQYVDDARRRQTAAMSDHLNPFDKETVFDRKRSSVAHLPTETRTRFEGSGDHDRSLDGEEADSRDSRWWSQQISSANSSNSQYFASETRKEDIRSPSRTSTAGLAIARVTPWLREAFAAVKTLADTVEERRISTASEACEPIATFALSLLLLLITAGLLGWTGSLRGRLMRLSTSLDSCG